MSSTQHSTRNSYASFNSTTVGVGPSPTTPSSSSHHHAGSGMAGINPKYQQAQIEKLEFLKILSSPERIQLPVVAIYDPHRARDLVYTILRDNFTYEVRREDCVVHPNFVYYNESGRYTNVPLHDRDRPALFVMLIDIEKISSRTERANLIQNWLEREKITANVERSIAFLVHPHCTGKQPLPDHGRSFFTSNPQEKAEKNLTEAIEWFAKNQPNLPVEVFHSVKSPSSIEGNLIVGRMAYCENWQNASSGDPQRYFHYDGVAYRYLRFGMLGHAQQIYSRPLTAKLFSNPKLFKSSWVKTTDQDLLIRLKEEMMTAPQGRFMFPNSSGVSRSWPMRRKSTSSSSSSSSDSTTSNPHLLDVITHALTCSILVLLRMNNAEGACQLSTPHFDLLYDAFREAKDVSPVLSSLYVYYFSAAFLRMLRDSLQDDDTRFLDFNISYVEAIIFCRNALVRTAAYYGCEVPSLLVRETITTSCAPVPESPAFSTNKEEKEQSKEKTENEEKTPCSASPSPAKPPTFNNSSTSEAAEKYQESIRQQLREDIDPSLFESHSAIRAELITLTEAASQIALQGNRRRMHVQLECQIIELLLLDSPSEAATRCAGLLSTLRRERWSYVVSYLSRLQLRCETKLSGSVSRDQIVASCLRILALSRHEEERKRIWTALLVAGRNDPTITLDLDAASSISTSAISSSTLSGSYSINNNNSTSTQQQQPFVFHLNAHQQNVKSRRWVRSVSIRNEEEINPLSHPSLRCGVNTAIRITLFLRMPVSGVQIADCRLWMICEGLNGRFERLCVRGNVVNNNHNNNNNNHNNNNNNNNSTKATTTTTSSRDITVEFGCVPEFAGAYYLQQLYVRCEGAAGTARLLKIFPAPKRFFQQQLQQVNQIITAQQQQQQQQQQSQQQQSQQQQSYGSTATTTAESTSLNLASPLGKTKRRQMSHIDPAFGTADQLTPSSRMDSFQHQPPPPAANNNNDHHQLSNNDERNDSIGDLSGSIRPIHSPTNQQQQLLSLQQSERTVFSNSSGTSTPPPPTQLVISSGHQNQNQNQFSHYQNQQQQQFDFLMSQILHPHFAVAQALSSNDASQYWFIMSCEPEADVTFEVDIIGDAIRFSDERAPTPKLQVGIKNNDALSEKPTKIEMLLVPAPLRNRGHGRTLSTTSHTAMGRDEGAKFLELRRTFRSNHVVVPTATATPPTPSPVVAASDNNSNNTATTSHHPQHHQHPVAQEAAAYTFDDIEQLLEEEQDEKKKKRDEQSTNHESTKTPPSSLHKSNQHQHHQQHLMNSPDAPITDALDATVGCMSIFGSEIEQEEQQNEQQQNDVTDLTSRSMSNNSSMAKNSNAKNASFNSTVRSIRNEGDEDQDDYDENDQTYNSEDEICEIKPRDTPKNQSLVDPSSSRTRHRKKVSSVQKKDFIPQQQQQQQQQQNTMNNNNNISSSLVRMASALAPLQQQQIFSENSSTGDASLSKTKNASLLLLSLRRLVSYEAIIKLLENSPASSNFVQTARRLLVSQNSGLSPEQIADQIQRDKVVHMISPVPQLQQQHHHQNIFASSLMMSTPPPPSNKKMAETDSTSNTITNTPLDNDSIVMLTGNSSNNTSAAFALSTPPPSSSLQQNQTQQEKIAVVERKTFTPGKVQIEVPVPPSLRAGGTAKLLWTYVKLGELREMQTDYKIESRPPFTVRYTMRPFRGRLFCSAVVSNSLKSTVLGIAEAELECLPPFVASKSRSSTTKSSTSRSAVATGGGDQQQPLLTVIKMSKVSFPAKIEPGSKQEISFLFELAPRKKKNEKTGELVDEEIDDQLRHPLRLNLKYSAWQVVAAAGATKIKLDTFVAPQVETDYTKIRPFSALLQYEGNNNNNNSNNENQPSPSATVNTLLFDASGTYNTTRMNATISADHTHHQNEQITSSISSSSAVKVHQPLRFFLSIRPRATASLSPEHRQLRLRIDADPKCWLPVGFTEKLLTFHSNDCQVLLRLDLVPLARGELKMPGIRLSVPHHDVDGGRSVVPVDLVVSQTAIVVK